MQALRSAPTSRVAHGGARAGSGLETTANSVCSTTGTRPSLLELRAGHRRRQRRLPPSAAARDREVWLHTQEPSIDNDSSSAADSGSSTSWSRLLAAPTKLLPRALEVAGYLSSSSGSTPRDVGSGTGSTAMRDVDEVYENQRLLAVVWKPPLAALDWPEWSDGRGNPVLLAKPPSEDPRAWEPVVTGATDDEGWCYATVFK